MIGRINSFQSMGTVDGPGVRFVVFLQGCNLRCAYCHNPETWDAYGGMEMSAEEVLTKAIKYRSYFGENGGITLTGGEPLMQAEFVYELLLQCKKEGIHSVIDTNGTILTPATKKAIALADLLIVDLKMNTEASYQTYIGTEMHRVLSFIKEADEMGKDLWIRQVILPTINDRPEDIRQLMQLLKPFGNIKKIELLPFQKLCLEKYEMLKVPFPLASLPQGSQDQIQTLYKIIKEHS